MLAGTLCGIEMGMTLAGVPFSKGGVAAAMDYLTSPHELQEGRGDLSPQVECAAPA